MPEPKDLEDFIAGNKVAAVAPGPYSDLELDQLLGLKMSEGYSGPGDHEMPEAASGMESAGRRATPEEEKKQKQLGSSSIPVGSGNK